MSDLLDAASSVLGTPADLVQRSAAARAAANGTSVDDVLAAWSGGAPVAAPVAAEAPAETTSAEVEEISEAEPVAAAVAVIQEPVVEMAPVYEPEPEEPLEPAPLSQRVMTALRIGAWTGAALGVVGFLTATAFWAPNTLVVADTGPVVEVSPSGVTLGVALVSVIFGAIVAGMSRAATARSNPAMQLSSSKSSTAWLGALVGIILGLVAGALLSSFGTIVEGSDPQVTQLPVLATLGVMVIGGAILGAATASIPQLLGVPVAVEDPEEVAVHKGRLGGALGIPMVGLLLLVLLVLPFAWTLIESNELLPGAGGAVVAIIAAGGILGFAALSGTKPEMRISFGDVMVALVGIGVVLIIILAVLFATSDGEGHAEDGGEEATVVQLF